MTAPIDPTAGWIGVGLDGVLATYTKWEGPRHIGAPIWPMVARVKAWLQAGRDVRVFTARVWPLGTAGETWYEYESWLEEAQLAREAIQDWCSKEFGQVLPVTCVIDYGMTELWLHQCTQVVKNAGTAVLPMGAGKK